MDKNKQYKLMVHMKIFSKFWLILCLIYASLLNLKLQIPIQILILIFLLTNSLTTIKPYINLIILNNVWSIVAADMLHTEPHLVSASLG